MLRWLVCGESARRPSAVAVVCLAILLNASSAIGQAVRAEDLERFVEQYKDYVRASDSVDWNDLLYVAASAGGAPETVIARFAEQIGVSNVAARDYASVILETSVLDEGCATRVRPSHCGFAPGQHRYDRAASFGRGDRTGQLLIAVGRSNTMTRQDEAALVGLIRRHPAASSIFTRLFVRRREAVFLLALAASGSLPEPEWLLAATSYLSYYRWSNQDDAWRLALLESVESSATRNKASTRTRAAIAQTALWWKLELGLIDDAVASYYAYPTDVRSLLPIPGGCLDTVERCFQIDRYRLSDELAAALWLTGHTDDARRLLQQAMPDFGSRPTAIEARFQVLSEAVSPAYSTGDLFSLFVNGLQPDQQNANPDGRMWIPHSIYGNGWVFVARSAGPAARRVIAGRLRTAGYESMASYLEQPVQDVRVDQGDAALQTVVAMFPRSLNRRQAYWRARVDAATMKESTPQQIRASTRQLPAWWIERRLPDSTAAWRNTDAKEAPPEDVDLPVAPDSVVRYEARNGERAIVYRYTYYDLQNQPLAPGFWFTRTVGGIWSRPLYLGLQRNYPYVVTPASRLPMLDGQRLRIEVRVSESATTMIRVPPGPLARRGTTSGLYLEFDLARVAADRDGDGLTDVAEWSIGLDFSNADTDGDGVVDGRDPLPLVAYRPTVANDRLAHAIVAHIFSTELPIAAAVAPTLGDARNESAPDRLVQALARTRFLIGEPALFAGVATPFPLMVYSRADVASLTDGLAPFGPVWLSHIFSSLDGTTHHVGWSSSGGGGAFTVTCETPNDACRIK